MGVLEREDDLREEWLPLDLEKVDGCGGGCVKWQRQTRDFNWEASDKY